MKSIEELKKEFAEGLHDQRLKEIYVDEKRVPYNRERYIKALDRFKELYGDKPVVIFSAPGRSEVCGNHTDHQNGQVLATSINLDAIAVVSPETDNTISL